MGRTFHSYLCFYWLHDWSDAFCRRCNCQLYGEQGKREKNEVTMHINLCKNIRHQNIHTMLIHSAVMHVLKVSFASDAGIFLQPKCQNTSKFAGLRLSGDRTAHGGSATLARPEGSSQNGTTTACSAETG